MFKILFYAAVVGCLLAVFLGDFWLILWPAKNKRRAR